MSHYEALRRQVLDQSDGIPHGQGLALFMRSGMRVWMQAWRQCMALAPELPPQPVGSEAILPLTMQQDVAMILASMVLCGCQEVRA